MNHLLSGPVESIDHGAHTVTVTGALPDPSGRILFSSGEKINVYGVVSGTGLTSAKIVQNTNHYRPAVMP